MSHHSTVESIITTGFTLVGSLVVLGLLVAGIALDSQAQPARARASQGKELPTLITQTCAIAGNVAVQAVEARESGVKSSVLITQLHNMESQHAIKMPGMLAMHTEIVLSVYSNPTMTSQAARVSVEDLCIRVFAEESR